jgi:hypothetical protein
MAQSTTGDSLPAPLPTPRKIVQFKFFEDSARIFILHEDGTLWTRSLSTNTWLQIYAPNP